MIAEEEQGEIKKGNNKKTTFATLRLRNFAGNEKLWMQN